MLEMDNTNKNQIEQETTPKRRGRKRKTVPIGPLPKEEPCKIKSKRGRLRKSINYYSIANPEEIVNTDGSTKPKSSKVVGRSAPVTNGNNVQLVEENKTIIGTVHNKNHKVNSQTIEQVKNEEQTEEKNLTENNSGDKKYKYTGETMKMMKLLFSHYKKLDESTSNVELDTKTKTTSVVDSNEAVCAVCEKTIQKPNWAHHKQRFHNNLAWKVGEPPLDLNDQSFVMATLNALYKKKKPLYCDKCGESKKSVVGFLSHQTVCKKSIDQLEDIKISCELCGKKMLPVSLMSHTKLVHTDPKKVEIVPTNTNKNGEQLTYSKRKAARKALQKINDVARNLNEDYFTETLDFSETFVQDVIERELEEKHVINCKFNDCTFQTNNFDEILKHLNDCDKKPVENKFMCKKCLLITLELSDMICHLELIHNIKWEDDDTNFKQSDKNHKSNITTVTDLPLFLHCSTRKCEKVLYPFTSEWTIKFCEENFQQCVHQTLMPANCTTVAPQTVSQYLPKLTKSCQIGRIQVTNFLKQKNYKQYEFKQLKLFECELYDDGNATIFCGGPVTAIAWLPTPYNVIHRQMLAVCVQQSPDARYMTVDNYHESTMVQFWDFGELRNQVGKIEAKLAAGLLHDVGPVWHLEWCPSGAFNEQNDRLGLLAMATSDGDVQIHSIPTFGNQTTFYFKSTPVLKLILQRSKNELFGGVKYYPTRISWGKFSGHNVIAVGYTNGLVGIFNIQSNSCLLKQKRNGINCIFPFKCFPAHTHSITALVLHHLNGGCRWLMTGSLDRYINLWDLNDVNYPVSSVKKNIVTDGMWLTNWLCYTVGFDEASTILNIGTTIKQARDYLYDLITILYSSATVSSISGSDWLNGILQANTVGEITAIFPHQLLYIADRKSFKDKRMLFSHTRLVNFEEEKKNNRNEPITYGGAEKKYGLLFCDNKMKCYDDFKETSRQLDAHSTSFQVFKPELYPMQAINKIAFNPNRQASLYYVTGYQAGFLRLTWMEFLKNDIQIN